MTSTLTLPTDPSALALRYASEPEQWPMAPRFTPAARWYARVATADDHEAWLLTWLPGQQTDLHDHGGSAGAFTIVSGTLTEYTLDGPDLRGREFATGEVRRFGSRHVHLIRNTSRRPAVSLHVYAPALTRMTRYELSAEGLRPVAVERAGADW
ncbi:cysteine dioxygenase [Rhizomonospora bruguierae]|uniref:cysteine dioxygenase n=1 Tax=Rhizomonospora bruguierae TaxID=1581705 RepID=UPI001BCDAAD8|nr:cysteine dioxygenase family protein [Micromonospora sp. NBRC 107566]